jgi:hypothetical protein
VLDIAVVASQILQNGDHADLFRDQRHGAEHKGYRKPRIVIGVRLISEEYNEDEQNDRQLKICKQNSADKEARFVRTGRKINVMIAVEEGQNQADQSQYKKRLYGQKLLQRLVRSVRIDHIDR